MTAEDVAGEQTSTPVMAQNVDRQLNLPEEGPEWDAEDVRWGEPGEHDGDCGGFPVRFHEVGCKYGSDAEERRFVQAAR